MIDLLVLDLFDAEECDEIVAEMRGVAGSAATVYGVAPAAAVQQRMRKVTRVMPSDATRDLVARRLLELKGALESHFDVILREAEEPQFLRYVSGDYFVAHQDGNTPLIRDSSLFRKVSVSIFVSAPDDYDGGALVLHGGYPDSDLRMEAPAARGTLAAFRSETTHEVTPLTRGERCSIVSWYRV